MTPELIAAIDARVDADFADEVAFLREMVRVPTDTPPCDNAPHAERTDGLLDEMGFHVERHPVPKAEVDAAGLVSVTNLIVRRRFGDGPVVALNAKSYAITVRLDDGSSRVINETNHPTWRPGDQVRLTNSTIQSDR